MMQLKDQNGEKFLMRDGIPCTCPLRQPLVLPGNIQGQLQITDIPCSSRCAKFNIEHEAAGELSKTVVLLQCGSETSEMYVEEITDENNNKPKILKL